MGSTKLEDYIASAPVKTGGDLPITEGGELGRINKADLPSTGPGGGDLAYATTDTPGKVTRATDNETVTGSNGDKYVTPAGDKAALDARYADDATVITGTSTTKLVPVAGLQAKLDALAPADIDAETARSEIVIPATMLLTSYGTPGGLDIHNGSVPVFKFRTTTGDEGCVTPMIVIPSHWAKMEIAIEWLNRTTDTGDVRWRYEEAVPSASAELNAMNNYGVVAVVDPAQTKGYIRAVTIVTGRTIPVSRRVIVGIARTNSNVADTLNNEVGLVNIFVRESA